MRCCPQCFLKWIELVTMKLTYQNTELLVYLYSALQLSRTHLQLGFLFLIVRIRLGCAVVNNPQVAVTKSNQVLLVACATCALRIVGSSASCPDSRTQANQNITHHHTREKKNMTSQPLIHEPSTQKGHYFYSHGEIQVTGCILLEGEQENIVIPSAQKEKNQNICEQF